VSEINKPATDVIVHAMENADDMHEIVVVYKLKDDKGFAWMSNVNDPHVRVGMLYSAAYGICEKTYNEEWNQG